MAKVLKTVTLAPGEAKPVEWHVRPNEARVYQVSVDGLSGSFRVLEPPVAQFVVSDLIITPTQCYPEELVRISVTVRNIGSVAGNYTVTCEVL